MIKTKSSLILTQRINLEAARLGKAFPAETDCFCYADDFYDIEEEYGNGFREFTLKE